MKRYSYILLALVMFACTTYNKNAYQSGEDKDDKNYHAKTAKGIIQKSQSIKKKHDRKAEKKRAEDIKNAKASADGKSKKVVKKPGPFSFY